MSSRKGSFSLGNDESPYTSSSKAAYGKPSGDNQQGPVKKNLHGTTFCLGSENENNQNNFVSSNSVSYGNGQPKAAPPRKDISSTEMDNQQGSAKKNLHGTTFCLGSENDNNQNNFVSSNSVSYGNGQPKAAPLRKDINSSDLANVSNFVTTNSSSYGSVAGPRKQINVERSDMAAGSVAASNNVSIGRHSTGATRNTSADNVLASYGSGSFLQQGQGQAQGSTQNDHTSTFITSNTAAFRNPSGSSSSSSRSNVNDNNNNNVSAFQSSNSSYGRVSGEKCSDAPAGASFGRPPQAARSESGSFQIGFSTDSSFATSNSVAFSKPTEYKERLQNHNKHSIRTTPTDSDNPLGPTNLNQGVLPPSSSSSSSSFSSLLSSAQNNNNGNNSSNSNNNNSNSNQTGTRKISEKHHMVQRSSFNPITGQ